MTWLHTILTQDTIDNHKLTINCMRKNYEMAKGDKKYAKKDVKYMLYSLKYMIYWYNGDLENSNKYHNKLKDLENDFIDGWLFGGEPLTVKFEDAVDGGVENFDGEESIRRACEYFKEDVEMRKMQLANLVKYKMTHLFLKE